MEKTALKSGITGGLLTLSEVLGGVARVVPFGGPTFWAATGGEALTRALAFGARRG